MIGWEGAALGGGGLFTLAVLYFAFVRIPRWRVMEVESFLADFERAINVADKVQPLLLLGTIAAAGMLSRSLDGTAQLLAQLATAGFVMTLLGSLVFMVPLQRRMIRLGKTRTYPLSATRSRWVKGALARASVAVLSFALLTLAILGV